MSRIEGIDAGIRLTQRRARGYISLDNLVERIHLRPGGIPTPTINPPTETEELAHLYYGAGRGRAES